MGDGSWGRGQGEDSLGRAGQGGCVHEPSRHQAVSHLQESGESRLPDVRVVTSAVSGGVKGSLLRLLTTEVMMARRTPSTTMERQTTRIRMNGDSVSSIPTSAGLDRHSRKPPSYLLGTTDKKAGR